MSHGFRRPVDSMFGERRRGGARAKKPLEAPQAPGAGGRDLREELLAIVLDEAPWEQKVLAYHAALEKPGEGQSALPKRQETAAERTAARCEWELAKPPVMWFPINMDMIKAGHAKRAPGMLYNLDFPWSEQLLAEFGAEWLTKAFHTAGTIPPDNWITKIVFQEEIKVTAGNNAGKFLFEVRYAKKDPLLHTKLFAKVPFPLSGPTQTDRLSSSFYKQPMDLMEIQTYRLMEAALPFETPRFYFGDISNETTNYILITERVPFTEFLGINNKKKLKPYEVEGPYDKCKDFNLRGDHKQYYMVLIKHQAAISGLYKKGGLPDIYPPPPTDPGSYGVNPSIATGESPSTCSAKLDGAVKFISDTAKVVFPKYAREEPFLKKFKRFMMKLNAYSAELNFWKNANMDYSALGHQNLNVDNAYFWRDEDDVLQAGVFDFGGFACSSLPHKLWWMFNMAEFDQIKENVPDYIDYFIDEYEACGGPRLDRDEFEMSIIITAMQNCMIMIAALPNALKQCPQKEWATIKDRHDPRIADNVDNKSTLRSNIHVLNATVRVLEEMDADTVFEKWIQEIYVGRFGLQPKDDSIIGDDTEGNWTGTTRW